MKNRWVLVLLSSFLFFLGIRGFWGGAFIWVAFWPWFYLLDRLDRPLKAFFYSALVGFLFYLQGAIWLTHVTVVGYLLLCIVLSLYFAFFGWIYKRVRDVGKGYPILFLSCLWTFLEYVRSLGPFGFPWFLLGLSQFEHLKLIQIVSIGNIYILSFLIVGLNLAVYRWIFSNVPRAKVQGWLPVAVCLLFILGSVTYGYLRLGARKINPEQGLKVALIQANVPQDEKWDAAQAKYNLEKHIRLSMAATAKSPDLMVWPETALPTEIKIDRYVRQRVENLARKSHSYLLLGGNDWDSQTRVVTNSAFLIDPTGNLINQYDKLHLVPYGEYVPFRKWMPWVGKVTIGEIDFSPGHVFKVFHIGAHSFSAVICFEDTLAYHVRRFVTQGANLMVNLTNDAWFGKSSAPREHLQLSAFAALANGVGLVRATNTGVSAFISPYGEILETLRDENGEELEVEGLIVRNISTERVPTFYQRYGDIFAMGCGVIVLLFLVNNIFCHREGRRPVAILF